MHLWDSKRNAVAPYVPGDLTEEKHRDLDYGILNKYRYDLGGIRENSAPLQGYPGTREDFYRSPPKEAEDVRKSADEFYQKHKEMLTEEYNGDWCYGCRKDKRVNSPIIAAIRNFDLAKKLHKENLEHQPLPDTVSDAFYRKLQMQRHREPGLALKEGNYASGVAWKAYAGYGPTRCTKLKVFRPKTSICNKIKDSANDRPSSVSSFDKKWRFIRQSKVTPIQLAVCWDLTPENPTDEPKRTPHIDGSNGSMAPAVFSLVHTPDGGRGIDEEEQEQICDGLHNYSNNALPYMYDPQAYRAKTAKSISSSSTSKASKRIQSAAPHPQNPDPIFTRLHSNSPEVTSKITAYKFCSRDCYQRSKKTPKKRLCVACEMRNVNIKDSRPKTEYKMAFKAGIPQKNFKRQDYPEHWRLATIYQHSYKPMQARKRPLLATVFK
ncbi:hypothetical protein PPYR_07234 [Photinus pyralis]|uniref:DUF4812 domain-containing protein n=1 Tax=Photinus pyralis TaxID=7054 RepID=A0A5N4APV7_PHOPY|nr:uncharacterized protein LOC116168921 isoform X2 [Photinus pyralis]KAB0799354.1 hypothetical protein PPYR_07234 [Photinus pyralis]